VFDELAVIARHFVVQMAGDVAPRAEHEAERVALRLLGTGAEIRQVLLQLEARGAVVDRRDIGRLRCRGRKRRARGRVEARLRDLQELRGDDAAGLIAQIGITELRPLVEGVERRALEERRTRTALP